MSTITNDQMTIQEETVLHTLENIVDGVDIEYLVKITQTKKKLQLEVGDAIVWQNGTVEIIERILPGNLIVNRLADNVPHTLLIPTLKGWHKMNKIKIYKEVSTKELNI